MKALKISIMSYEILTSSITKILGQNINTGENFIETYNRPSVLCITNRLSVREFLDNNTLLNSLKPWQLIEQLSKLPLKMTCWLLFGILSSDDSACNKTTFRSLWECTSFITGYCLVFWSCTFYRINHHSCFHQSTV